MQSFCDTNGTESEKPHHFRVLGIPVSAINLAQATSRVANWAGEPNFRSVFVREVASLMAAVQEPHLAQLHEHADLVVPDGTPLVWLGKLRGLGQELGRVAGADLVDAVCKTSIETGQSHFFYGGRPGVAEEMARRLAERYPGLKISGTFSPPMRDIGPSFQLDDEARSELELIRQADPDFVWVGLSSPKQEYWMMKAGPVVGRGVFFGVGAAFDFHAGSIKRAPSWLRNNGLEWAHRLYSEPRRLWHRYLVLAPRFVIAAAWEELFRRRKLAKASSLAR